jgi:hypothetical protein
MNSPDCGDRCSARPRDTSNPVRRHVLAISLFSLVAAAPAAFADSILVVSGFSGSGFDAIGVTPFNPALGTLDSVNVGILGTLTVSGNTLPFAPNGAPVPYPYQVTVSQDFSGFANTYFSFDTAAIFGWLEIATGSGEPLSLTSVFSYSFTLNSGTDLLGFTVPSASGTYATLQPPLSISGMRADFYPNVFQINEVDLIQSWAVSSVPVPVFINNVQSAGSMTFEYNYTPTPPVPPVIPEPSTLALVGPSLLALSLRRRRAHIPASRYSPR